MSSNTTADDTPLFTRERPPEPGLVLLWAGNAPTCRTYAFQARPFDVGRDARCQIVLPESDNAASRRHAEVGFEAGELRLRDLGSRNGTHVGDRQLAEGVTHGFALPTLFRIGGCLFLAVADLEPYAGRTDLLEGGVVVGAEMRAVGEEIADLARHFDTFLVRGEPGTGKERMAKLFHAASKRARGPYVAVSCAEIPHQLAESMLFGARRGAFTGADRDVQGAFEAANGGVLFLDEVGELPLDVQPKLLRALQERVIRPLGTQEVKKIDVGVVSATNRNLRDMARAGQYRADLIMRLAERELELPPLRERLDEIPFLVELARKSIAGAPVAEARFVEACMRASWDFGNVRELIAEVRRAAAEAARKEQPVIRAEGTILPVLASDRPPAPVKESVLPPRGGAEGGATGGVPVEGPERDATAAAAALSAFKPRVIDDTSLTASYEGNQGNVAAVARELGISRTTVYARLRKMRAWK